MDLLLIATILIGLWAFYAVVGNERERRVQKLQFELDQARRTADAQSQQSEEIPVIG
jgi:hypothetical protein